MITLRVGTEFCKVGNIPAVEFSGAKFHPVFRYAGDAKILVGFLCEREYQNLVLKTLNENSILQTGGLQPHN